MEILLGRDDKGNVTIGRTIQGSVLDCNKAHLLKKLREYDKQLYLVWNSSKRKGYGMWEVRRLPNEKTAVFEGEYEGVNLYRVQYVENNMIHHVMDVEHLSYAILDRLKEMDTWAEKNFLDAMEERGEKYAATQKRKNREDLIYSLKSNKKYLSIFKEAVTSGYRPQDFFSGIYDKDHEMSVFNKKV